MNRFLALSCLVLASGIGVEAAGSPVPGGIGPGLGWVYRAQVTDLARDVTRTTTLTFLGVGEPGGRQAIAVIGDDDRGTTLSVWPVGLGAPLATPAAGPDPVVLRWPTVLDLVPELRGGMPPVQGVALPAVPVPELELTLSFQQLLDGGAVGRGEIRLALGPHGAVTVPAGTFGGLYASTYSASWGNTSHQGQAWWPGEDGAAGPGWIPVRAQGTLGVAVRYTWELVERVVLDAEELLARLRDALAATERVNPPLAREARDALREVGIDL